MSVVRETNLSRIKAHYGLALDEIKVKRSLDVIQAILCDLPDQSEALFLHNEMQYLRKQLVSLREMRS